MRWAQSTGNGGTLVLIGGDQAWFGATRAKCYDRLGVREGGSFYCKGSGWRREREGAESIGRCDEVGKLDDAQISTAPCPFVRMCGRTYLGIIRGIL